VSSSFWIKSRCGSFWNSLFNYSSRVKTHRLVSLSFSREERTFVCRKGYEGAHISRLENVRERFYVATAESYRQRRMAHTSRCKTIIRCRRARNRYFINSIVIAGQSRVSWLLFAGRVYNESTRYCRRWYGRAVQELWTRKGGRGRARERSDKLHPLSTNDFVLFTNTFVPRLFILFLYGHPFFSSSLHILSLPLFFWYPPSPTTSLVRLWTSLPCTRIAPTFLLSRGHIDVSSGVPAIHK